VDKQPDFFSDKIFWCYNDSILKIRHAIIIGLIFSLGLVVFQPIISMAKTDEEQYQEYYEYFQQLQEQYGDLASGAGAAYDVLMRELQKRLIELGIKIAERLAAELSRRLPVTTGELISDSGLGVPVSLGSNNPFGGTVVLAYFCTATANYWIRMAPPLPNLPTDLIYNPGSSILYAFYQVTTPGNYLLGTWEGQAECAEWDGPIRRTVMIAPNIYMVGTSGGGAATGGQLPDGGDEPPVNPPPAPRPTSTPPSVLCNQSTLGGWNFGAGIENQIGDASPSLKSLLYCVCNKMKQTNLTGIITSISDNHHIGRLAECRNPSTYRQCGSGSNCCYHSITSCHYGGSHSDNRSYAADLGMGSAGLVKSYISQCGGTFLDEGNHIHAATGDCRE
jgi:hypothetical protein